jgi:predicted nucleic acid-binding protein
MDVVSNTSPLIALAKIDQLAILETLFQTVLIPHSVSIEFLKNCTKNEKIAFEAARGKFLNVMEVTETYPFSRRLDAGEQDALALAIKRKAVLIIDDRKGFNEAKEQKLIAVSTRAVLKLAEEKRIIPNYGEMERSLRRKSYFLPSY